MSEGVGAPLLRKKNPFQPHIKLNHYTPTANHNEFGRPAQQQAVSSAVCYICWSCLFSGLFINDYYRLL
jgi:hypothetical protein